MFVPFCRALAAERRRRANAAAIHIKCSSISRKLRFHLIENNFLFPQRWRRRVHLTGSVSRPMRAQRPPAQRHTIPIKMQFNSAFSLSGKASTASIMANLNINLEPAKCVILNATMQRAIKRAEATGKQKKLNANIGALAQPTQDAFGNIDRRAIQFRSDVSVSVQAARGSERSSPRRVGRPTWQRIETRRQRN